MTADLAARERLILPLDVADLASARAWVDRLRGEVGVFKVGLELFTAAGPEAVRAVHDAGASVFLDLKLHDIPATVARAVESAARLGVRYLTVHASSGPACLAAAATAAKGSATVLLAVTVLTSLDALELAAIGLAGTPASAATRLGRLAHGAGIEGLVCSAHECRDLREAVGERVLLVVPGVRPRGADSGNRTARRDARRGDRVGGRPPRRRSSDPGRARPVHRGAQSRRRDRRGAGTASVTRIVAGARAVVEALRGRRGVAIVYVAEDARPDATVETESRRAKVPIETRTREEMDRLANGVRHRGVIAIGGEYVYATLEEILNGARHPPLVVALDQVSDPHNFGAIVRSAVAFGVDGVVTLENRAAPVTPVVVRASAGATEHAHIARVTNLARALDTMRDRGLEIVGLAGDGTTELGSLGDAAGGRVVVVGSEGTGLRRLTRERCDELVRIPMSGAIGSLNASVAAGIALYEAARLRPRS